MKRVLILLVAAGFVWFAFFRKPKLPQAQAVNRPPTPNQAIRDAAGQTIRTVAGAVQKPLADWITGILSDGNAQSVDIGGPGGVYSPSTEAAQIPETFSWGGDESGGSEIWT